MRTSLSVWCLFIVAPVLVIGPIAAIAEPKVYRCVYLNGANDGSDAPEMNRAVVDVDQQRIELQVAESLGTSRPVNWVFDNRSSSSGFADSKIHLEDRRLFFAAGGIRYGASFAIVLEKESGLLIWQTATLTTVPTYSRYKCRR